MFSQIPLKISQRSRHFLFHRAQRFFIIIISHDSFEINLDRSRRRRPSLERRQRARLGAASESPLYLRARARPRSNRVAQTHTLRAQRLAVSRGVQARAQRRHRACVVVVVVLIRGRWGTRNGADDAHRLDARARPERRRERLARARRSTRARRRSSESTRRRVTRPVASVRDASWRTTPTPTARSTSAGRRTRRRSFVARSSSAIDARARRQRRRLMNCLPSWSVGAAR